MIKPTDEIVSDAIEVSWRVAHSAETLDKWLHYWSMVQHELTGAWCLLNYGPITDPEREAEMKEHIHFLRGIAHTLQFRAHDHPLPPQG